MFKKIIITTVGCTALCAMTGFVVATGAALAVGVIMAKIDNDEELTESESDLVKALTKFGHVALDD